MPSRSSRHLHNSPWLHQIHQPCPLRTRYQRPSPFRPPRASQLHPRRNNPHARPHDPWPLPNRIPHSITTVLRCTRPAHLRRRPRRPEQTTPRRAREHAQRQILLPPQIDRCRFLQQKSMVRSPQDTKPKLRPRQPRSRNRSLLRPLTRR
jgi:hypothetical protein